MNENKKIMFTVKKYLPFFLLAVFTVSLMIYFKNSQDEAENILEKGKGSLIDFYTDNLKPIFYGSKVSNADVFDFAVNNRIPLDKENNKFLTVGFNSSGEEYFRIDNNTESNKFKNYREFTASIKSSPKLKSRIDSILDIYKPQVYASLLKNDDNSFAVNSRLAEIRKSILVDLINTINQSDYKSSGNSAKQIRAKLTGGKIQSAEFIVFAPDTIILAKSDFSEKNIIKDFPIDDLQEPASSTDKKIKLRPMMHHKMENIMAADFSENSAVIPGNSSAAMITNCRTAFGEDSLMVFNPDSLVGILDLSIGSVLDITRQVTNMVYEMNMNNVQNVVEMTAKMFMNASPEDWEEFGKRMDSLYADGGMDSIKMNNWNDENFKRQIKKNAENFKAQMEKLKNELKEKESKKM